jgi:hypothetical protein
LTRAQKEEAYELRQEGATLQWLGDKYGLTRERMRQILEVYEARRNGISGSLKSCKYPALKHWMIVNDLNYTRLARLCGTTMESVRNGLTERTDIKKKTIDAILEVTGLTYEEAFRK